MELYIYDTGFTLLGVVDEITSLIWTRRYWKAGEFSLLVPLTDKHARLLTRGRLIVRKDADEAGQIRYRHISKGKDGLESIELQGLFLSHWIGKRLIMPVLSMTAPTHSLLCEIVRANLIAPADPRRAIPNVEIGDPGELETAPYSFSSEPFSNALEVCETRAQLAKIGFKLVADVKRKKHVFTVYKGADRTSGQTQNAMCVFSPDFDNVLSQDFTESDENVASAVFLQSSSTLSTEARDPVEVSDDARTGLDRVEIFAEASDVTFEEGGDYAALLRAKGASVLAGKVESVSFSSVINTGAHLKYGRDFDLGDRVTCLNRRWGVTIDARITEVSEQFEGGKNELQITFGTSLPTLNDQLKWR